MPEFKSRTEKTLDVDEFELFGIIDIVKRLGKLTEGKAPGVDGVSPMVLKNCAEELGKPLYAVRSWRGL